LQSICRYANLCYSRSFATVSATTKAPPRCANSRGHGTGGITPMHDQDSSARLPRHPARSSIRRLHTARSRPGSSINSSTSTRP
jgi:hypothetical protein